MTLVALFTLASTTMYNSLEGVKTVVKTVDARSHRRWGRPRHDYTDSHGLFASAAVARDAADDDERR